MCVLTALHSAVVLAGGRDGRVLSSRTINALPPLSGVQLIKLSAAARSETFSVDGRRL